MPAGFDLASHRIGVQKMKKFWMFVLIGFGIYFLSSNTPAREPSILTHPGVLFRGEVMRYGFSIPSHADLDLAAIDISCLDRFPLRSFDIFLRDPSGRIIDLKNLPRNLPYQQAMWMDSFSSEYGRRIKSSEILYIKNPLPGRWSIEMENLDSTKNYYEAAITLYARPDRRARHSLGTKCSVQASFVSWSKWRK